MTNVSRQWSNAVNTELIYYVIAHYDDSNYNYSYNDTVMMTMIISADETCRLLTAIDRQQAAIILGYVIVTLCHGTIFHFDFDATFSLFNFVCILNIGNCSNLSLNQLK